MLRVAGVEIGPRVQDSGTGMGVGGPFDPARGEEFLDSAYVVGQAFRRNGEALQEADRMRFAGAAMQERLARAADGPDFLLLLRIDRGAPGRGGAARREKFCCQPFEFLLRLAARLAIELDEQNRLRAFGEEFVVSERRLAREIQHEGIEQFAGRRLVLQNGRNRFRRRQNRGEGEHPQNRRRGQIRQRQLRFERQRKCAFRAADQLAEVKRFGGQDIVQKIARRVALQMPRRLGLDQLVICIKDANQIAQNRPGAGSIEQRFQIGAIAGEGPRIDAGPFDG